MTKRRFQVKHEDNNYEDFMINDTQRAIGDWKDAN